MCVSDEKRMSTECPLTETQPTRLIKCWCHLVDEVAGDKCLCFRMCNVKIKSFSMLNNLYIPSLSSYIQTCCLVSYMSFSPVHCLSLSFASLLFSLPWLNTQLNYTAFRKDFHYLSPRFEMNWAQKMSGSPFPCQFQLASSWFTI